jgi:hypothetical protein
MFRGPAACRNPGPLYDPRLAAAPGFHAPSDSPAVQESVYEPGGIRASRPRAPAYPLP